jgi:hypothetical protein
MFKGRKRIKRALITLLLISVFTSFLGARTISTQTLKIYAYIPERTTIDFTEEGEIIFNSNVPSVFLDVYTTNQITLLSVVAR